MSGLYLSRGLFPEEFLRPTVNFILDCQLASGEIPWFEGGYADPWDHTEAAMGLAVGGELEAARRAYRWLASMQLPDGSWSAAQRRFPERGATAEIGGQNVRISDLADRQVVNVYFPLGEHWNLPPEPAAAAAAAPPPPPPPAPEPEPEPEMLPTTATQVPAFALLGGLLLLLGGAVTFVRTRL